MWVVARALLSPHHRVLELGARYGTTSCVLANLTGNGGRVVSAEPDPRVHKLLLHNRKVNSCSFHAWLGSFSTTPLALQHTGSRYRPGYETTFAPLTLRTQANAVPNLASLDALEAVAGMRINAAVLDCEGCIETVWGTGLFERIDLLIMEEDGPRPPMNYTHIHERLRSFGLEPIWRWLGSSAEEFSAWRRRGTAREAPSCRQYAARMGSRWGAEPVGCLPLHRIYSYEHTHPPHPTLRERG